MTPCSFGETYCLHLQGRRLSWVSKYLQLASCLFTRFGYSSTPKMRAECSFETSVNYQTVRRHNLEAVLFITLKHICSVSDFSGDCLSLHWHYYYYYYYFSTSNVHAYSHRQGVKWLLCRILCELIATDMERKLRAYAAIKPSSGAAVSIPSNSLQLTRRELYIPLLCIQKDITDSPATFRIMGKYADHQPTNCHNSEDNKKRITRLRFTLILNWLGLLIWNGILLY
jgi:hypothetical protein